MFHLFSNVCGYIFLVCFTGLIFTERCQKTLPSQPLQEQLVSICVCIFFIIIFAFADFSAGFEFFLIFYVIQSSIVGLQIAYWPLNWDLPESSHKDNIWHIFSLQFGCRMKVNTLLSSKLIWIFFCRIFIFIFLCCHEA